MPPRSLDEASLRRAVARLARRDPDLRPPLERWGPPPLWRREPGFPTLVRIILEQQVSLASARAAYGRLLERIPNADPVAFLELDDETLRDVGFSRQKASYCRGLARAIVTRELVLEALPSLADQAARDALLAVKGIGPWTAEIYLLMALRRPDAWPSGDLALARSMRSLKGLDSVPDADEVETLAEPWRPWRAAAARLLWHAYLSEIANGRDALTRSRAG